MKKERFYIDYRLGKIVKNLDTSFLAPEMFIEIEVSDEMDGVYKYVYEDKDKRRLDFSFTLEHLNSFFSFQEMEDAHCKRHNFVPVRVYSRLLYMSQSAFEDVEMHL